MVHNIAIDGTGRSGQKHGSKKSGKRAFVCLRGHRSHVSGYGTLSSEKGRKPRRYWTRSETACQNAEISIEYQNGEQIVLLDGENVNDYLRTEEVGDMASVSSAVPRVRAKASGSAAQTCQGP